MKRVLVSLFNPFFGKKFFFAAFEKLYYFSLYGMNYVYGDRLETNGEKKLIARMSSYLTKLKNPVLFDVGANVGDYSMALANSFGNNASIYSFEPSPLVFEKLKNNTSRFNNVNCTNAGLGSKEETVTLYFNKENTTTGSVYNRDMKHWGTSYELHATEQIRLTTLDAFCESNKIERINFLKLDVEGNEMNVFSGAANFLKSDRIDFIQFEFGVCQVDSRNFFKDYFYLLTPKFRLYRILKDGLVEIKTYNESLEIFRTANYFCVSKSISDF